MRARTVLNIVVSFAAALVLAGCYVTAREVPAGTGPIDDPALIGTWEALDEDGKPDPGTYLHFLKAKDEGKPLTFVLVDDHSWMAFDLVTTHVGKRQMFAAKQTGAMPGEKPERDNFVGFYEVKGDVLLFHLLDTGKIKDAIQTGRVKGTVASGVAGKVTLTGSPKDLATFFATVDIDQVTGDQPAKARRIGKPRTN